MMWITINLKTQEVRSYKDKDQATSASLRINKEDPDHPAMHLYYCLGNGRLARYEGRLYRRFGEDFDKSNPWNKDLL